MAEKLTRRQEADRIKAWMREHEDALFVQGTSFTFAAQTASADLGFIVSRHRIAVLAEQSKWQGRAPALDRVKRLWTERDWFRLRATLVPLFAGTNSWTAENAARAMYSGRRLPILRNVPAITEMLKALKLDEERSA